MSCGAIDFGLVSRHYLDVRKLATRAGADKKLVAMDETHPALASNEPGTDRSWEVRCLA